MKQTLQRGFTLIELLVVIAIIGILAAVVLASLNDARDSGANASAKTSLNNLRSQAEIFYNAGSQFTYTNVCSDGTVSGLLAAATTTVGIDNGDCNETAQAYAAHAQLRDTGAGVRYFCVDSTGFAGETATDPGTGTVCP